MIPNRVTLKYHGWDATLINEVDVGITDDYGDPETQETRHNAKVLIDIDTSSERVFQSPGGQEVRVDAEIYVEDFAHLYDGNGDTFPTVIETPAGTFEAVMIDRMNRGGIARVLGRRI